MKDIKVDFVSPCGFDGDILAESDSTNDSEYEHNQNGGNDSCPFIHEEVDPFNKQRQVCKNKHNDRPKYNSQEYIKEELA